MAIACSCAAGTPGSQMSRALLERAADGRHRALSAGTTPADRVHPEVVEVMREPDTDVSDRVPRKLTRELAERADVVVRWGCRAPRPSGRRAAKRFAVVRAAQPPASWSACARSAWYSVATGAMPRSSSASGSAR